MTDRRAFLGVLGLIVVPVAADAQRAGRLPLVGVLRTGSPPDAFVDAFRMALRDLGYVEGKTIAVTLRWAEGKHGRLPALAAELVRLGVDVIVTGQQPAILAAKQATGVIPIVMIASDPVGSGLVDSLARPGRNLTGLALVSSELDGKRLELLTEVAPKASRIAILQIAGNPATVLRWRASRLAAEKLGVSLQAVEVSLPFDFESAFAVVRKGRAGALLVPAGFTPNLKDRKAIVELAAKHRMPTLYDTKEFVDAGGLMAYGPSLAAAHRRAAAYVAKILKGANPAELPVEQPSKFELVINLKTAKALGLTISPSLLQRADQVIE